MTGEQLIVTVRTKTRERTYAFDASIQSVLWVGLDGDDSRDAFARIESLEKGVAITPVAGAMILLPNEPPCVDPVGLSGRLPLIASVRIPHRADVASLFVRRATPGLGRYQKVFFRGSGAVAIGRSRSNELCYRHAFVSASHAQVSFDHGAFVVEDLGSANGTTVNGVLLDARQPRALSPGDVVQVVDLVLMSGTGFLLLNEPDGLEVHGNASMSTHSFAHSDVSLAEGEAHTYYPAPRISCSVRPFELSVDAPPARKRTEEQPALMRMGPSFLMSMMSVPLAAYAVSSVMGGGSLLAALPSLAMAVAMVGGTLVWPLVLGSYEKKRAAAWELRRAMLYVAYLDSVENRLASEAQAQACVLRDTRHPVLELMGRAREKSALLMNRTLAQDDFMELRVGIGNCAMSAQVSWPTTHFTLEEDPMAKRVENLSRKPLLLQDVPLAFNPAHHALVGVLGGAEERWEFLRGILVQVCALYSYVDVKVVLLASEGEREQWQFVTSLGHLYDESGNRLIALTPEGVAQTDLLLGRALEGLESQTDRAANSCEPFYLVVCTNGELAMRSDAMRRLVALEGNGRFCLLYVGGDLCDLPRECDYIIDLAPETRTGLVTGTDAGNPSHREKVRSACMYERSDIAGTLLRFDPDIFVSAEQAHAFALDMARMRLDVPGRRTGTPEVLGFLEMFQVGNVAHLNIGRRWVDNDASRTLQTPVGVDTQGECIHLNLHESAHGPHGLIAGTTGSGKSEFIIAFVLSLCVNYAPDEVSFVLIDYKGGGLAGAFSNDRHMLPHMAGTITNLDGGEIQRSLVSIQSELKRRQNLFKRARERTGYATMDIHRYLSLYRQGVLEDPLPHLFIIADEFAELKQQEPEFMKELVSAARIGRSLGVHLILATQKPSGVVDDQIWSNARFKVSLKVADAADSKEMIRRNEAALLTRPGEFYLLVGYDESFRRGQASYAGLPYVPADCFEPRRSKTVELLDAQGSPVTSLMPARGQSKDEVFELDAVLGGIEQAAHMAKKRAPRLWLDPLPARVMLAELMHAYGEPAGELPCVVGEADDPWEQRQFRYELDLARAGNVALYGSVESDVEGLMRTMALGMALSCSSNELWLYAIDLGAGSLASLGELPHMGGVVRLEEEERLGHLLRMLEEETSRRRVAGTTCAEDGRSQLPRIVVLVANYGAVGEAFPDHEDRIVSLMRDAPRYGMHFLVTAATPQDVRMRIRSCFGAEIPTVLNDSTDYLTLLGGLCGLVPTRLRRRGLAKVGSRVLEFQGASSDDEDIRKIVREGVRCGAQGARLIPELPPHVHTSHVRDLLGPQYLPVGYAKTTAAPACFDFYESPYMLVVGNERESLRTFLRGCHELLLDGVGVDCRFVDTLGILRNEDDSRVLQQLDDVESFVQALYEGTVAPNVVVFTSIVQTMELLEHEASGYLRRYVEEERCVGTTHLIIASEEWRLKAVFDKWLKVLSAYGDGLWLGGGFLEQTTFRFARALPEFRKPAQRGDGFLCLRGSVEAVRLVEPCLEKGDKNA